MHSSVGIEVAPANCVISQRFASWSYTTTGSPKPLLSQTPPKSLQRVAMSTGPKTEAPVLLSKTWKPWLTIWTYWSRPTSPFVSGGAQLQATPGKGIPSKLRMVPGIFGPGIVLWTTGSRALLWSLNLKSDGFSAAICSGDVRCGWVAMARTGREMSFLYDLPTVTPSCAGVPLAVLTCVPEPFDCAASPVTLDPAKAIEARNSDAIMAPPIVFLLRARITAPPLRGSGQGSPLHERDSQSSRLWRQWTPRGQLGSTPACGRSRPGN